MHSEILPGRRSRVTTIASRQPGVGLRTATLACAVVAGCSEPPAATSSTVAKCVPGKVESCPCGGGPTGTQTCRADGTFGGCNCGGAADAATVDAAGLADATGAADSAARADSAASADGGDSGGSATSGDSGLQSGDGVLVQGTSDAVGTQTCEPCGYGALKGLVCAPNEQIYISNAKVTLTVQDCDGATKTLTTATADDGSYAFPQVPCGKHSAKVTAGSFSATYNVNIKTGQTRDLTGIGQKLCFAANARKIAVFWGQWDHQHKLLDKLGFLYTFFNFEWEYFNNVSPADIPAVKTLRDPSLLAKFDVLFFNCGSAALNYANQFPEIGKNLNQFVLAGGSIYASDLSWAYVEAAFPDAIDFYGKTDLPAGPSNDGPQQVQGNTNVPATIKDAQLATYVGTTVFTAKYGPGPLVAVQQAGTGTTVHVSGVTQVKNMNKKGMFDPETVPHTGPLVLSHQPASKGAGRVVYTTFHNDEQADAVMLKILHYLVFLL